MKKVMKRMFISLLVFLSLTIGHAHEGMWLPGYLDVQTRELMKELGLELPANLLYDEEHPSIKDAVVNFGGFCSGVIVSDEGLVFTNHHCGFAAIQQHSTVENNYIRDGFVAWNRNEELPNPDLYVSFLVKTEDITSRILKSFSSEMEESERLAVIDSMTILIENESYERDTTLRYVVSSHYGGNEFVLSSYRDYNDVRLVYAPPSSVGKFGGDTDNWVWPRHTGDFAVFRIYAGKDNQPADYSVENVPFHPKYVVPVSLKGYEEGSYCMTLGYPGSTERYISSFGVQQRMETDNAAMIDVRGIKQKIWKDAMEKSEAIRIKYSSKYAASSNYWKNSLGMNHAITELDVIGKKRELENELKQWIRKDPEERNKYLHILTELELNYRNRKDAAHASAFFNETFLNSAELIILAFQMLNFDLSADSLDIIRNSRHIYDLYDNLDLSIDKDIFEAVLKNYEEKVDALYLPSVYDTIATVYDNDYRKYVDNLYSSSLLTESGTFKRLLDGDTSFELFEDPAIKLVLDLLVKMYDFNYLTQSFTSEINKNERLLTEALREMEETRNFYPNADFTMRVSAGIIAGYSPSNAVRFKHYTTTKGIFEKADLYKDIYDFKVQPQLLSLLSERDFGIYADSTGELNVCFISDNDITGGNSGSGMYDSEGRLIGLAFDGNWEAMSSDLLFESQYQRCIGVDIRYVLYIMDKYSNAKHLIEELELIK